MATHGLSYAPQAREAARHAIVRRTPEPASGQGRAVRTVFEDALTAQGRRLRAVERPTSSQLTTLVTDDFLSDQAQ
jgi:hypothetical protein